MSRHRRGKSTMLSSGTVKKGVLYAIRSDRSAGVEPMHCGCGKIRHPSRKSAKRHLKTMRGFNAYGGEVYRCPLNPAAWHIGWRRSERGLRLLDAFRLALFELAGLPRPRRSVKGSA